MKSKVIIALIIVFNFILSVPSNVYAATSSDSKGQITVDVSSDSDTLVKEGVKVGVVYVAKADGELLNVFGDVGSGMVDVTNSELAVKLYTYIKETGYDVNIKETDSFGKAEFDGLELGVYLVFDTEADLREKTFNPFLVSIPETPAIPYSFMTSSRLLLLLKLDGSGLYSRTISAPMVGFSLS